MQKLFELQNKIGAIAKSEVNPFYNSKYFDINTLIEALKPILNECGLVLLQPLTSLKGDDFSHKPALKTMIYDVEAKELLIESVVPLPENPDPQKMGAIITYFRRYAVQSLLFLQAEDDDANSVIPQPKPVTAKQQAQPRTGMAQATPKLKPCDKCGSEFKLVPAGVSKSSGKPYNAFYACSNRNCKRTLREEEASMWMEKPSLDDKPF